MSTLTGMIVAKGKDPDDLATKITVLIEGGAAPFGNIFHHGDGILCLAVETTSPEAALIRNGDAGCQITNADLDNIADQTGAVVGLDSFIVADSSLEGAVLDPIYALVQSGAAAASSIAVTGTYTNTVTFTVANNAITAIHLS